MKYIIFVLFLIGCATKTKPVPPKASESKPQSLPNAISPSTQLAMDRFYYLLSSVGKRDSFLVKKYENEVLYYKTQNEKYRIRGNRYVDSTNKYINIIDSITKEFK